MFKKVRGVAASAMSGDRVRFLVLYDLDEFRGVKNENLEERKKWERSFCQLGSNESPNGGLVVAEGGVQWWRLKKEEAQRRSARISRTPQLLCPLDREA